MSTPQLKLKDFPKSRYSMMEYRMFEAMPKDGTKVTSADIAATREAMGKWDVENPLGIINVTMDRLAKKVQVNREPFRIKKLPKKVGNPTVKYWVERK